MFVRDESRRGHPVTDAVTPGCEWVLAGEGFPTRKLDGSNVKIEQGVLLKRQKPKDREYDRASYVPCRRDDPGDKWFFEAFDRYGGQLGDGIYECIGPKIQGNPEAFARHQLVSVVPPASILYLFDRPVPRTFDELQEFLRAYLIEGVVFHHPDGRMAKIKRRDFGIPWPVR